jgi:hypothetical protein
MTLSDSMGKVELTSTSSASREGSTTDASIISVERYPFEDENRNMMRM